MNKSIIPKFIPGAFKGIVIEAISPVNNRGNLKAFITVKLPDATIIRGCRLIKQPGQKAWLSLPQIEIPGDDGKSHYYTAITLPEDTKAALDKVVLEAAALERIL